MSNTMTLSNLTLKLPFTFETKSDGAIHDTDETKVSKFPTLPNRSVWHLEHRHIAYVPQAVAFAVETIWKRTQSPATGKQVRRELSDLGFGLYSKGSISGNLSVALKQGLISNLNVRNYDLGRQGKKRSCFLWAPTEVASKLNHVTAEIANWIDSPNEVTTMDLLAFLDNFVQTAKSSGVKSMLPNQR
jgi:hypothetical protein